MIELLYKKIKYIIIFFLIITSFEVLSINHDIYSFKNVHIENEDFNSLKAKELGINKTIKDKFIKLLLNLTTDSSDLHYIVDNYKSEDYLKNIVIKNEIVTEKKYISDIDIFFDKKKIINLFKKNNILFSDTISPSFLILSSYNFDGTNILWERNNWNQLWYDYINLNDQINISLPNSDNTNKILLSSQDIFNFNTININKILNYYHLNNSILLTAIKEYDYEEGKIYINLLITLYEMKNQILSNVYSNRIPLEKLNSKNLLEDLTFISYQKIFNWWKNETITNFNKVNNIICTFENPNINLIQNIKNSLSSISQIDGIFLKTLSLEEIKLNISYFGELNELINILSLSNLEINLKSNECYLTYGAI